MSYQHYRSPFGDTTYTKVFVGGLAWETPTDVMRRYFEQFGEILEAVIIIDKTTGKSKGYGFVTFRDPESARRACSDPNPMIDGRRANCNIASLGRPRPSPPRGRTQIGNNPYQGSGHVQGASSSSSSPSPSSYGGVVVPSPLHPHPPPPPPPPPPAPAPATTAYIYPPYGYATYPSDYAYHQGIYNPHIHHHQAQYYHQLYAAPSPSPSSSSSSPSTSGGGMNTPYFYGYSMMQPSSRGAFSPTSQYRIQGPPYLYYPSHHQMDQPTTGAGAATYYPTPFPLLQPTRQPFFPSPDSQTPRQTPTTTANVTATTTTTAAVTATTTTEADAGTVTSGSPSSA